MIELRLDLLQTLPLAAVVCFLGIQLERRLRCVDRLNITVAVVGFPLFTVLAFVARDRFADVQLDTTAQPVPSVAFFTSIDMPARFA